MISTGLVRQVRSVPVANLATAIVTMALAAGLHAQQSAPPSQEENRDLAKQLTNPLASLVSVPLQFNWEQGVGPSKLTRFVLNVQPVMPFTMSASTNLIVRLIAPLISQPPLAAGGPATGGIGDITTSFFIAPSQSKHLIWGAGPVVVLPSTSEPTLGSGKWSAGPTIVALKQSHAFTVGALWNQVWSYSGDPSRSDVNQMFLQPFFSWQTSHTLTVTLQSEMTANWDAANDDDKWTVPINMTLAKLATFGAFPASYQLGFAVFAAHPAIGPTWKVRSTIVILLPRSTP